VFKPGSQLSLFQFYYQYNFSVDTVQQTKLLYCVKNRGWWIIHPRKSSLSCCKVNLINF